METIRTFLFMISTVQLLRAAFRNSLLVLKIYEIRNCRFSVLAVNFGTQSRYILSNKRCKVRSKNFHFEKIV